MDISKQLQTFIEESQTPGGWLRFSGKTGELTLREDFQEEQEISHKTEFAVNFGEIQQGWICWNNNQVIDKKLYGLLEKPVNVSDLPENGPYDDLQRDGWKRIFEIPMYMPKDNTKKYKLSVVSESGFRSIVDFLKNVSGSSKDLNTEVPVVTIEKEKFVSKGYTNYKPVLKIKSWMKNSVRPVLVSDEEDIL